MCLARLIAIVSCSGFWLSGRSSTWRSFSRTNRFSVTSSPKRATTTVRDLGRICAARPSFRPAAPDVGPYRGSGSHGPAPERSSRSRFASLEALNLYLEQRCRERQGDVLRGHRESIAKRLERDLEAMTALPGAPFDACHQAAGQVSSQSLVRYHNNDYSVPVAYGYRQVWVRGYVDRVVIGCAAEVIARHPRSYEGEDMVFDPLHYLPLIERKVGALDQAAPLAGWELPDAFATLRRLMEARSGRAGRREYVQVLRLFETFGTHDVHAAVRHALRLGAIGFDAVKHLVLCRVEKRPPKLDLDVYPYLPKANVGKTCAASYLCLMSGCVR